MKTEELLEFINEKIPNFIKSRIIDNGIAYHYTNHTDAIISSGKLLGVPITENLDQTQFTIPSIPAKNDPGVVFAYLNEQDAREEGRGCDILEIKFKKAIETVHEQEAKFTGASPTILILTTDIIDFRKL